MDGMDERPPKVSRRKVLNYEDEAVDRIVPAFEALHDV